MATTVYIIVNLVAAIPAQPLSRLYSNLSVKQGCRKQFWIGQANEPGWAGCTMATMLKMTNF